MANLLYPRWKEALLQISPNVALDGLVRAALIDTDFYRWSKTDAFLSDLVLPAIVAISQPLASKSFANGVFSAAPAEFDPFEGETCRALILFTDSYESDTSRLVAYLDSGVEGLPWVPDGGPARVRWNERGIFAI